MSEPPSGGRRPRGGDRSPRAEAEGRLPEPTATRVVHDGEVLRLRISDYRRPSGLVVRREVIDHPGAVVIAPVEGDVVLLVRQPRDAVRERLLELPAGKKDRPGEDALECARRELAEEVGREARTWRDLGGFYTAPAILTEWIDCFLATDLEPSDVRPLDEEEIEVVPWPLADLPALIERVRDAKTLIGLLRLAREIGV